jgi:hypothetical protein
LESLESLSREELIRIIIEQQRVIERLRSDIEELKKRSSAAPFSKGNGKANPQKAGRKPGQGPFRRRMEPSPVPGQQAVRVAVTVTECPECGGPLGECWEEKVSTTDIPAQPQPEVQIYAVEVRRCARCGKSVRGQHPDVREGQHGATGHRVGSRVKAMAQNLHYGHGVPVRKIPAILNELTGVRLTQSAITQDAMKQVAGPVGQRYEELREQVREQAVIHTDDTGWRVRGEQAFLMAFVNQSLSVYQIRSRHRNEEVRELIPADFAGVMVCDRGKSYDATELREVAQQKCLAHLIRNASAVERTKTGQAAQFSRRLKELLRKALALSTKRGEMDPTGYRQKVVDLEGELEHHLRNRIFRDDDNQRLLNGVGIQSDREQLLRFLHTDGVEPTNNRAERDLRPAVIARKVSQCSKNELGARAFEAFTSVIQTIRKTTPSGVLNALLQIIAPAPIADST